jgi:hypothetical protein
VCESPVGQQYFSGGNCLTGRYFYAFNSFI